MAIRLPLYYRFARKVHTQPPRRTFSNSSAKFTIYGVVGIGQMGYPMAKNLQAKISDSDTLVVFDANEDSTRRFIDEIPNTKKTSVAKDLRHVAEQSDTILTILPSPSHVRTVFSDILQPLTPPLPGRPPKLFIDCSTIDPITSRSVAASVTTTLPNAAFVDAPMSGGVVGARAGKLTFMLGSASEHVPRASAALAPMARRVVHLGPQGAGLAGKLANNYLLALNNLATAEAMAMGVAWGLDAKALAGMINSSTGRCWPSEVNNPVPGVVEGAPAGRGYEGGFGIGLMRKDLGLALDSAREYGVRNELGARAMECYCEAEDLEECKGKDFSSVYRWLGGKEKPADGR